MNYQFSQKVANLKPSAIREILKFTSYPGYIPFSAGNPAPEAFPAKEIEEISANILKNRPIDALQYSITEGYNELRQTMKKRMEVSADDDLILTSGAQQVMSLTTQALCNEGDTIICEDPSFIGSLNAFRSFGANLCGIPMQNDGMDLESLENALKTHENVKFIYVIPNFQNPSGITTSFEKRKAIYELARQYGVLILEDNPYGETRFAGESIPNIKSLDTHSIVIYAGSFSKVVSPGIRVGYAIASREIISKLTVCKQVSDVHTNIFFQLIINEFINNYDYDGHIQKIRGIYKNKSSLMMDLLDKHCPSIKYNIAEGGLFIWCKLPTGIDMLEFCKKAVENKVAVVPGTAFLADENGTSSYFRINFSTPTDEQIEAGVEILKNTLAEMM